MSASTTTSTTSTTSTSADEHAHTSSLRHPHCSAAHQHASATGTNGRAQAPGYPHIRSAGGGSTAASSAYRHTGVTHRDRRIDRHSHNGAHEQPYNAANKYVYADTAPNQ